jgi:hypothetical protein
MWSDEKLYPAGDVEQDSERHMHSRAFAFMAYSAWLGAMLVMWCPFTGTEYLRPVGVDASQYLLMAQRQFGGLYPPYVLRWLTPWLVRGLRAASGYTLGWDFAWYLVDVAALLGCAILFDRFLSDVLKLRRFTITICVMLLLSNFVYSIFLLRDPFLVDPLNNLFWMAALLLLFRRRHVAFLVVVAIGSINKEVVLFLAPLYPLLVLAQARDVRRRSVWTSVLQTGLVALFYMVYRLVVQRYFGHSYNVFATGSMTPLETATAAVGYQKSVWDIFDTLKFTWITFAWALLEVYNRYGWRNRFVLCAAYILAALCFGRLFATDANRVFAMAAPIVIAMTGLLLESEDVTFRRLLLLVLLVHAALNLLIIEDRQAQLLADVGVLAAILFVKRGPIWSTLSPSTIAAVGEV